MPSDIRRALEKGVAYLESSQLPSGEIPPTPEMTRNCVRDPVVFPAALAARGVRSRALDFLEREMDGDAPWRRGDEQRDRKQIGIELLQDDEKARLRRGRRRRREIGAAAAVRIRTLVPREPERLVALV